jgi:carboxypeptidase C (cathepsin A)
MMKSAITDLKKTIKNNIKVLVYNGQNDYTVNTAGVLNYLNTISLPTFTPWKTAKKNIWRQYSDIIGWTKVYKNFWFAVVNGAGHKITTDQPNSCFDLLGRFVYDDQNWNQ